MNQDLQTKIREAAASRGLDPDVVSRIAGAESSFDPSAKNPKSTAQGLFQVTQQTWKDFGGTKAGRSSIDENIRVGLDVISSNKDIFQKKFQREPSASELYAMHFLGAKDAPRVLSADPNAPLKNIVPEKVVKANPFLQKMSVADFIAFTEKKMGVKPQMKQASRPTAPAKRVETPEIAPGTATFIGAQAPRPKAPTLREEVADLGPSYDAAMASVALADTRDDDEDEDISASEKEETASIFSETPVIDPFSYLEDEPTVNLASGEVRNPQRLAFGGLPYAPIAMVGNEDKQFLREAQSMYDTYAKNAAAYNAAYEDWNNKYYKPYLAATEKYNQEVDAYNAKANRYLESIWGGENPGIYRLQSYVIGTTPGLIAEQGDLPEELSRASGSFALQGGKIGVMGIKGFNQFYTPEELVKTGYNPTGTLGGTMRFKNVEEAQAYLDSLPSYQAYKWMQENQAVFENPDPKRKEYFILRKGPDRGMAAPGEFTKKAPTLAKEFTLEAPTAPSGEYEKAKVEARAAEAKKKQSRQQLVFDVLSDPERYNLSLPKMFADGGFATADAIPTGAITDDTRAAMSNKQGASARDILNTLKRVYGEGASNLESLVRGSAAAIPGFAGDIGQAFDIKGLRNLPSTEQILKATPRATAPTKEGAGFEEVGTYMPLPVSPSTVKAGAKAAAKGIKAAGPQIEEKLMKIAPAAEPMYISRPAGGVFPSAKSVNEPVISRLDKEIKDVAEWINLNPSPAPERKAALNFLDTKVRDYFKKQAGSVSDPVREALIEGKIKIPKDSELEEMFPQALIEAARKGDTTAMRLIEQNIDKSSNIKSLKMQPGASSAGIAADTQASEEFNQIILDQMKRNPNIIPDSMLLRLSKKNADKLSKSEAAQTVSNIRAKLADNPNLFNTVYEEKIMRMLKEDPVRAVTEESMKLYPSLYGQLENVMNRREGIMAIQEGMPITDVSGMPKILGISLRQLTEYAEMIPPKELERMSVPDVVAKVIQLRAGAEGAKKYADKAEKLISAGKPVPENISTFGTTPIMQPDSKGFVWREITDPAATQIQAKMLGNSIAGYSRPGTYGTLGKGINALKNGEVRLFGLYNKDNQLVTNVEYITDKADKFKGRIPQFFGNGPKTGNVIPEDYPEQVYSLINYLNPTDIPPSIKELMQQKGYSFPK